ncbi:MAG: shikimate dehydrogenase [Fidelibacterota bacterium]
MKRFAVIGDPIAHSLSPTLHSEIYRQLGIHASYEKIHLSSDQLSDFMVQNKLDGLNVTIPHKTTAIPYLKELDKSAEIIGAVNCISAGKGYNTDWIGFLKAMELNDVELTGKDCLILGAGGAARAVAYALIKSNVNSITIANRTKEKAVSLTQWVKSQSVIRVKSSSPERLDTLTSEHIIINCTPLGMWPDTESVPMDVNDISKPQVLVDTIYNPWETEWLKLGKEKGAKTVGGLDMFIAQGLASADIWFGENIAEKVNLTILRELLISAI